MEIKFGQMEANIKVNGRKIKRMEKEYCIILMEIFMKDNGQATKPMDKEPIHIQMELNILDNGKMISSMGLEFKNGLMDKSMKGIIKMEQKQVRES